MLRRSLILRKTKSVFCPEVFSAFSRDYSRVAALNVASRDKTPTATSGTWSSPQDRIARNVFSSDYVHAWTLLEACLEHGNLDRAESVLLGLTEISGPGDITLAVNTYLQKLIDRNKGRPNVALDWIRKIDYQIPRFKANDATEALLIRNAAADKDLLSAKVAKFDEAKLITVLKQFELLGPETITKVLEARNIPVAKLDSSTRAALKATEKAESSRSDSESAQKISGRMASALAVGGKVAAPIPKEGYDTLEPTESPGLVSIRHVLAGLQRKSQVDQRDIAELAELSDLPHVQNKSPEDVDFFDIWKQLRSDDEKKRFDEILTQINERRQRNVETRGVEAARMRWKQMFQQMAEADRSGAGKVQLKGLETLLWEWNQAMMPLVEAEMARLQILAQYSKLSDVPDSVLKEKFGNIKQKALREKFEYAPYLSLAKPENLPAMTMMELLRLNSNALDSVKSVKAILSVGKNVEREHKLDLRRRNMKTGRKGSKQKTETANIAHSWPATIRVKIGSALVSMFMQVARVPVTGTDPVTGNKVRSKAPAFHHSYQYQNGNKVGVLRPHKVVANYLSGERIAIQPQQLPMLCEPRPWTSWDNGGYWYTPSTVIRSKDSPEQVAYVVAASERGRLQKVFDGLNVLGHTPWTINKALFNVLSHIWNTKQEFLDIPPHAPPLPDLSVIPAPPRDSDPSVLRDYRRKCRALTLENGRNYSQRCDMNYKLDIARALLGERFYMPHNLDFRGRAYPLSPHFNHLGNDVSRSLLLFWEGRKLGPRGLWWLKVHLANLFGVNKASHDDRVAFVEQNLDNLFKSAEAPLTPEGSWWQKADSPFQALAACIEIRDALNHPAGHENFESHLTVHQDGSCNGLQHYAALGGDFEGAREVNLESADKPQDVYSRVLEIVKVKVAQEVRPEFKEVAELVHPVLSRKVVKQTVMTHVYGVTYIGAREQIANRLREIDDFPEDMCFKTAAYLAQQVLGAVRELFTSAHEIQDWLGHNATRITRAIVTDSDLQEVKSKFVSSVIWTTPLGLPIVQPYRQEKRKQVETELQTVYITDPYSFQGVNSRKQRMAFPPNYIHSLDASHMLMSAISCSKDNIAFAAVHDSYWTHAADVDTLNTNLRQCFVQLHSDNLIEKLRDEFQQRYGKHLEVLEIPIDCEPAKKIRALNDEYSRSKYGKVVKLSPSDQIEMELNKEPGQLSPVDIMRDLGEDELRDLLETSNSTPSQALKAADALKWARSTEHKGTGLEAIQDLNIEEALENEEVESRSRSSARKLQVLVPLNIPEIPKRGGFDVRKVLDSPYFFS